jgi:hypothetical protein
LANFPIYRFIQNKVRKINDVRIKKSIFIFLVFKILYTFYGVFIFSKISNVGDAEGYLLAPINLTSAVLRNNTILMGTLTALLKKVLFFDFFVHLAYSLFSFYCMKLVIDELKLTRPQEYFLILMLLMPSFGTWTSIIVKESLSCSLTCIVLIWIINIVNDSKLKFPLLVSVVALYFSIVLRPVVGLALFGLIINLYLYKINSIDKYLRFFVLFSGISIVTFTTIFLSISLIKDELLPMAEYYFNPKYTGIVGGRELGFWKSTLDFYFKAPQGIFIANLGPNLIESIRNPLLIPYFFEGLFFIFSTLYLLFSNFYLQLRRVVISPYFLLTIFFGIIFILLLNYPFGLFNAGSATRYRSSYYHIMIVLLLFFYSKEKKIAVFKFLNS